MTDLCLVKKLIWDKMVIGFLWCVAMVTLLTGCVVISGFSPDLFVNQGILSELKCYQIIKLNSTFQVLNFIFAFKQKLVVEEQIMS